jgi:4-hydroxy-tetrahydrodipicolinate reductase
MKNIILSGCQGKMGHVLAECIQQRADCAVVAGFDLKEDLTGAFRVSRL